MKTFVFKGLMVPVFTSFIEDEKRTIDFDFIEKYATYLKSKNVHGVMVNGFTGEGMTLNVEERKRLAEEWCRVTRKHQLKLLLNIGGTAIADVYELATHAEKLGVDGILVLPDLFYRPVVEEDLVAYLRDVSKYAPSIPLVYYHIPMMTNVYLKMWRLYDLAEKEISTFGGIYYRDSNLERALDTWRTDRTVILCIEKAAISGFTLGFDAYSSTMMNILPEWFVELYDHVRNYRLKEALIVQDRIIKRVQVIHKHDEDYIVPVKAEFNKLNLGFKVGTTRKPVYTESMIRHF